MMRLQKNRMIFLLWVLVVSPFTSFGAENGGGSSDNSDGGLSSVQKLPVPKVLDSLTGAYLKGGLSYVPHHLSDDENEDEETYRFDYYMTSSDSELMTDSAHYLGEY